MRQVFKGQDGQAVMEYLLLLTVMIAIVGILAFGFRKTVFRVWEHLGQRVSAACPGCPAEPGVTIR